MSHGTLVAPSPVVLPSLRTQGVRSAHDAGDGLPFARQTVTPGGWLAGLVFGVVCLGAGMVLVVACVLLALALGTVALVRGGGRPLRARKAREVRV